MFGFISIYDLSLVSRHLMIHRVEACQLESCASMGTNSFTHWGTKWKCYSDLNCPKLINLPHKKNQTFEPLTFNKKQPGWNECTEQSLHLHCTLTAVWLTLGGRQGQFHWSPCRPAPINHKGWMTAPACSNLYSILLSLLVCQVDEASEKDLCVSVCQLSANRSPPPAKWLVERIWSNESKTPLSPRAGLQTRLR